MSPELSTRCQAHTESLTLISCSLGHHTEHPKWLKLVGSNPTLGSPPGEVTQSSHQLARKREPCHTDGPSSKQFRLSSGHHTEHARLINLKERITPSSNSFSFDLVSQYQIIIVVSLKAATAAAFIPHKSEAAHTASACCYKHTL